jgi:hypothetical protein
VPNRSRTKSQHPEVKYPTLSQKNARRVGQVRILVYRTVRPIFTVLVMVPVEFAPVTLSVNVPREAREVPMLSLVVPEVVTEVGENEAVAPEGRPLTLNLTLPV